MRKFLVAIVFLLLLGACSSSKLVDQYANPETSNFRANKILVIGLAPDGGLQKQFEFTLAKALTDRNINAVRSVDFFESRGGFIEPTAADWQNLESELMEAGFDAVLISKSLGAQSKISLGQAYSNLATTFESFSEYFYLNRQSTRPAQSEEYEVFRTETSLYCLCPGAEHDLIWRGEIDIVNPVNADKTIQDYVKTLVKTLKRNKLLFP